MISRRKFGQLTLGSTVALAAGVNLAEARPTTVKMPDIHMKHGLKEKRDSGNHNYFECVEVDDLDTVREEILHSGEWDILTAVDRDNSDKVQHRMAKDIKKPGTSLYVLVYLNKRDNKEGFICFKHADNKGWS